MESEDNVKSHNGLRCKKLIFLKKKNVLLKSKIAKKIKKIEQTEFERDVMKSYIKCLGNCSSVSMFGVSNGNIRLITPLTCDHKLCHICNWVRQKKIRRKYNVWFGSNRTLNKIEKDGNVKHVTNANMSKYAGWELVDNAVEYDLMHLTLTVPHTENGWRGKKVYFSEIMSAYNVMRKYDDWLKFVYGGEFGVETTKNKAGFHTHIHSLLFVRKGLQNRNRLHLEILRIWNHLTVDDSSLRTSFDENMKKAIKRGNKLITDNYLKKLNPRGATMIGLECIYTLENGIKRRSVNWNDESMLKAVMETISYHFAPKLFEDKEGNFNVNRIIEMLPAVYKKSLYRKFGCLHGEKSLNVRDDSLLEDYIETSEAFDEETGEVFETEYFATSPLNMYVKGNENKIHVYKNSNIHYIRGVNGREAVNNLINMKINNKI
ncbi:MAG: protein rep [Bacteroidales bacterium]|jgi:hypothetical protein|nr:protein rep [Bacteroidales bacterium]